MTRMITKRALLWLFLAFTERSIGTEGLQLQCLTARRCMDGRNPSSSFAGKHRLASSTNSDINCDVNDVNSIDTIDRRSVLLGTVSYTTAVASALVGNPSEAQAVNLDFFTQSGKKQLDPRATVTVQIQSASDRLGLQLADNTLRQQPIVYIVATAPFRISNGLLPGLILVGYDSAAQVVQRIQSGPWPVDLTFFNLAAGGDAFNDVGQTMVTPMDALQLVKQTDDVAINNSGGTTMAKVPASGVRTNNAAQQPESVAFSIVTEKRPVPNNCAIQTRKNDLIEIEYEARALMPIEADAAAAEGAQPRSLRLVYDSSDSRGTGQPYQMVLGSGDMIPGVDQGLYDMCPGEIRTIIIPPSLGYGPRASKLFRIPSSSPLEWRVKLISIDGSIREDNNDSMTRDEREGRALY